MKACRATCPHKRHRYFEASAEQSQEALFAQCLELAHVVFENYSSFKLLLSNHRSDTVSSALACLATNVNGMRKTKEALR